MTNYKEFRDKDGSFRFTAPGLVVKYYPTTRNAFIQEGSLPLRPKKFPALNEQQVRIEVERYLSDYTPPERPVSGLTCDASTTKKHGAQARVTTIGGFELDMQTIHKDKEVCNNVIAEAYGIGMGIKRCKEANEVTLYCDCAPAIAITSPGYKFKSEHSEPKTKAIHEKIQRAVQKLRTDNPQIKILKWNKDLWGEIPSDFGRK